MSLNDTAAPDVTHPLSSILSSIISESPANQTARLEEASKTAVDLTGLVKRMKPATGGESKRGLSSQVPAQVGGTGSGKRKTEFVDDFADELADELGMEKRAKTEKG